MGLSTQKQHRQKKCFLSVLFCQNSLSQLILHYLHDVGPSRSQFLLVSRNKDGITASPKSRKMGFLHVYRDINITDRVVGGCLSRIPDTASGLLKELRLISDFPWTIPERGIDGKNGLYSKIHRSSPPVPWLYAKRTRDITG